MLIFFLAGNFAEAQTCSGTLGDPIAAAGTDFGRGNSTNGNELGAAVTTYTFVNGTPNDGQYTIIKTTNGLNPGWHQGIVNHTPNDPNGYMMVVNANFSQGTFYQNTVNDLCPNTTYEFSAWIINILNRSGIKPNVKFIIENTVGTTTTIIKEFDTGDILEGSGTDWKFYGTVFSTPASLGTIRLKMVNINPGGTGNDLAIDDINFRPCGPNITTSTNGASTQLCAGESQAMRLFADVSTGYTTPTYQWQKEANNNWADIPSATALSLDIVTNPAVGTYRYRLLVAEQGNIQSANCRIASNPIVITVHDLPNPIASNNANVCEGGEIKLSVDVGQSFSWIGPNGFSSTAQNPTIGNATLNNGGNYTVTVKSAFGCEASRTIAVSVLPAFTAIISASSADICEGNSTQLTASGGTTYTWLPVTGLSNPNIANPLVSPATTTTYTVTVGNGVCEDRRSITINVLKNPIADAGPDKKVLVGASVVLNGKATGSNVSYNWQPTDYLDDPTKLNPIATPPIDISYKLVVQNNCEITSDEVKVTVVQKIEIPNTFSPNGDNINDTWNIPVVELFPLAKLKIFNRAGGLIYNGTSTTAAWDGRYKGGDLPVGTYYYTLYLNDEYKIYSGWVLLTR